MALSNWATLGITCGELTEGEFSDEQLGYSIEVYKSWIYLRDAQAHRGDETPYDPDVVMKINETSKFKYQRMEIDVWTPVSNEVYVVARTGYYHNDNDVRTFVGCGVYGYEGENWVGVTEEHLQRLQKHLSESTVVRNVEIPDNPASYNKGDLKILRQSGNDGEVDELYDSDENPIIEQAFSEDEE